MLTDQIIEDMHPRPKVIGHIRGKTWREQLPRFIEERKALQAWWAGRTATKKQLEKEGVPDIPAAEKSMRRIRIRRSTGEYVRRCRYG